MGIRYVGAGEISERWQVSERAVRHYCESYRVAGAYRDGRNWRIPEDAEKPVRSRRVGRIPSDLCRRMILERDLRVNGGIYHQIQVDLAYNSNRMEGSTLTEEQTRLILDNIDLVTGPLKRNDLIETSNHFMAFDRLLDTLDRAVTPGLIKDLHGLLRQSTADQYRKGYAIGEYKKLSNMVSGMDTVPPESVKAAIDELVGWYGSLDRPTLDDILEFHVRFERIHPFQDGNGRVGRLLMFRECLRNDIVPFVILDADKMFYHRGLMEWGRDNAYLRDTCLAAQDRMTETMRRFRVTGVRPTGKRIRG